MLEGEYARLMEILQTPTSDGSGVTWGVLLAILAGVAVFIYWREG